MENTNREPDVMTMKEVEWELKKRKVKKFVKDKYDATKKFCVDHKEELTRVAVMAAPAALYGIKKAMKVKALNHEEFLRKTRHWDPREGEYYYSKRILSSKELIKLQKLYKEGYSKGEALQMMHLSK